MKFYISITFLFLVLGFSGCVDKESQDQEVDLEISLDYVNIDYYKEDSLNVTRNVNYYPYMIYSINIINHADSSYKLTIGDSSDNVFAKYHNKTLAFRERSIEVTDKGFYNLIGILDYVESFPADTFQNKAQRSKFIKDVVNNTDFFLRNSEIKEIPRDSMQVVFIDPSIKEIIVN